MSNARDTAKNLKTGLNVSSFGNVVDIQKDGSTVGGISTFYGNPMFGRNSGARLAFDTNVIYSSNDAGSTTDNAYALGSATSRFTDLYLSGGAYIGGTGAANKLEDYEEGSWTPILQSGSTTRATLNSVGRYTKIGREVSAIGSFTRNTATSDSGHLRIAGLPFSRLAPTYLVPVGSGWLWIDNGTGSDILGNIYMSDSTSILAVVDHDVRGGRYVPYNEIVNGRYVYFRIDYTAA